MSAAISKRRARAAMAAAAAGLALACQAVLGIEELSELPRSLTPAAGSGGSTSVVGSAGREGAPAGGAGGAASTVNGGGTGESPGVLPIANSGDAGSLAPDAGPSEPGTLTVAGRVIDFLRRPVAGIPISVGGQPPVVTGAQGEFSVAEVEPPYDVVLTLNMVRTNLPARYGYVFQGLTRADPTLQLYSALPQRATSSFDVTLANAEFDLDVTRRVILAFASPDARFADEDVTGDTSFVGGINWTGPATTSGNVHALRVLASDTFGGSPPLAYEAYQTSPLTAEDDVVAAVTLDMQTRMIATTTLAGTVGTGPLGERSNFLSVRFADGTALPLLEDSAFDGEFVYLVPALANTSLVFAAADGIPGLPPYAVAWRDGLAPGSADVALEIPSPVTLGAPSFGSVVAPGTAFSWSAVGQSAQTFVWHLESIDLSIPIYEGIFVVTSGTSIQLPEFFDGFALSSGAQVEWSVETHGDAPDVDALTGPEGFLDPFSVNATVPVGPRQGGGYYTESARSGATMSQ
jgi:hypothetical protein